MNNEVTVIIPVFNTPREFFNECIKSIEGQDYNKIKVIVIDDGSTPNYSYAYQQTLKGSKLNYTYIATNNSGVATARNVGLKNVDSTYVTFLDSDDTIPPNYLSTLICDLAKNNADAVFCGYIRNGVEHRPVLGNSDLHPDATLEDFILNWDCYVCGVVYSAKSISNFFFSEGVNYGEDAKFAYDFLKTKPKILATSETVYEYRDNPNSAMNKTGKEYFQMSSHDNSNLFRYIAKKSPSFCAVAKEAYTISLYSSASRGLSGNAPISYREFKKECNDNFDMITCPNYKKHRHDTTYIKRLIISLITSRLILPSFIILKIKNLYRECV